MLAASNFSGHVILEVTTSGARTAAEREQLLTESLEFARTHLLREELDHRDGLDVVRRRDGADAVSSAATSSSSTAS